ncbi:MAG TPA: T9SS type A sorting domain-containing protein, partial [Bacteroidia bacterium]|nr:T9SS type A sorting domain-containing protein [Bacteroidia bacterium]
GMVSLFLFGSGGMSDTVGVASFVTPTTGVTSYKRFSAPLVYRSANAVANSIWLLASSKNDAATAGVGSTIWVDDLSIVINPTSGIMEHSLPEISLYPNPASDLLFIHNPSNARVLFSLYDVTGRKISEEKLNGVNNNLSLSDVPEGMYIYSLSDEHNAVVKTGKLVVRK